MKILIMSTGSLDYDAKKYKSELEDFKYEEVTTKHNRLKTYIEINSLEDLVELCNSVNHELIIDFRENKKNLNDEPFIEIYDDYRE